MQKQTVSSEYGLSPSAVEKIRQVFAAFPQVERAIMYGSRALGTYRPSSDIDLTLVGAELDHQDLLRILGALDDLLLPHSIDLSLHAHLDHPELEEHIRQFGREFYCRAD